MKPKLFLALYALCFMVFYFLSNTILGVISFFGIILLTIILIFWFVTVKMNGFDYDTLRRDKWIAEKIPSVLRSTNLEISHAKLISPLPNEEKEYWANEIKNERIPVKELKERIVAKRKESRKLNLMDVFSML